MLAASKRVADDLTRLIYTANAPIFGIDTHGKITEGNAKTSSLLGYNKDEEMGSLDAALHHREFKASVDRVLASALVGQRWQALSSPCLPKSVSIVSSC